VLPLYYGRYPFRAANDGLHEHDGELGAWDDAALDRYLRGLREVAPGESHDVQLSWQTAQSEQFWYGELGWHTICPLVYLEPADASLYLKRDYAPREQRASAAGRHARALPGVLEEARRHLTGPTSASMFRQAASSAREYADFYRQDLSALAGPEPCEAAAEALTRFSAWCAERAERAPAHYAMGEGQFERMLATTQAETLSAARLEHVAREELERNLERGRQLTEGHLGEVAASLGAGHLPADRLVAEASSIVTGLRAFLHERQLVSLPGETTVEVRPSPAGARWSFASMDNPGPFETSTEAYYYVTLPEAAWPVQEQQDWLAQFEPGLLHLITLHESFPGHFVHHLHMRHAHSRERKALRSYAFTEGWAHYCEEMMVDEGYHGTVEPLRLRLSQILAALDRCCRLLGSLRLHCAGDSVEDVAGLFRSHAFMEPGRALASARRGAFDPEYGYYTLGKLMLRKLRADQPSLSLGQFHDQILGWGSPPPALLRRSLGIPGAPL